MYGDYLQPVSQEVVMNVASMDQQIILHIQRIGYLLARQLQKITLLKVFECFESSQAVKYVQDSLSINRSLIRDT
ncbi:hypothetical protein C7B76_12230 [filamentous cyanobacterium CCP2]|nr:hypothetical protein C7B76_12230 [filamentous cyanobacterium CCP2]